MKTYFKALVYPVYIYSSIFPFPVSFEREKQKQMLGEKNLSKRNSHKTGKALAD